jgi:ribonucleoside-diphosphate reductase alpha chain
MPVDAKPQAIPKGIQMPLGLAPRPLRDVPLTENARVVMTKRYVRKDEKGQPAETIQDTFWRVASNVAMAEDEPEKFLPNSPTFTGAGTPLGNLSACFVLPIEDEMGAHEGGIFQTLRDAALIQKTGGGNGFSFSRLRAKGALVKN